MKSKQWLHEHARDTFVRRAQTDGFRARSAYKLLAIDDKDKLIHPHMTILDLGASPGSWSQVLVKKSRGCARIIAVDKLAMSPINGVIFIQGDFLEADTQSRIQQHLNGTDVDLVISDMSPNICGIQTVDQMMTLELIEHVLSFCEKFLSAQGDCLIKVFIGKEFEVMLEKMRHYFSQVFVRKPLSSRGRSSEVYLLGRHLH